MKTIRLFTLLVIVMLVLSACGGPVAAPAPTQPPAKVEPTKPPAAEPTKAPAAAGLKCDKPIKIGLITDKSGALAVYGAMAERSFLLGMEYVTGAPGKDNVFKLGDCEIQIIVADDKGVVETTATVARELIEVKQVDLLVGTVSSGGTATLQASRETTKRCSSSPRRLPTTSPAKISTSTPSAPAATTTRISSTCAST